MSITNPAHKPIFQTPPRESTQNPSYTSLLKPTPPTTQPRQYSSQSLQYQSNNPPSQNKQYKQVNIRISEKTNKPYLSTSPHSYPYDYSSSRNTQKYIGLQPQQLLQLISIYQYQIAILKDYIHESDLVQRQRIVDIFGFDYACCNPAATQQSKIVLKQLSIKIQHLIRQNNQLKQKQSKKQSISIIKQKQQQKTGIKQTKQDLLLLRQNQKLRMLLDQIKNSQSRQIIMLEQDINRLRKDNQSLNQLVRKYKNKIQILQQNARKSIKVPIVSQARNTRQSFFQYPPTQTQTNTTLTKTSSPQQLQFTKKQITKQLFQFSTQVQQKNKQNQNKIDILNKKIDNLQRKLKQYEKQRQYKIQSTMRKSLILTGIPKLKGDLDNQNQNYIIPFEDQKIYKKQQGKIRNTYKFTYNTPQQIQRKSKIQPIVQSNPRQKQISKYKSQIKQLQDNLTMQSLKNKNIQQQNNLLKRKLIQAQQQTIQKIQRIIKLQNIITQLQKQREKDKQKLLEIQIYMQQQKQQKQRQKLRIKQRQRQRQTIIIKQKTNPQLQKQLKDIIQMLKSCNINNFQLFFKQFNQILTQRKILRDTIEGYKNANQVIQKTQSSRNTNTNTKQDKQLRTALQQKVDQLINQNRKLLKRVTELQGEVQQYHQQIIMNQIQKLNVIKFNQPILPNGDNAIQWQKIVKNSIQGALVRLYNLQRKVKENQQSKIIQKIVSQQKIKIGQGNQMEYSKVRSLGLKQQTV